MIGHVQSRKAGEVLRYFDWIHSLDSLKLAERYARLRAESAPNTIPRPPDRQLNILLEMNVSGEASKEGFAAHGWRDNRALRESLWNDIRHMIELPGLCVRGLMTVPPIVPTMEAARPYFADLRALRDALAADFPRGAWDTLSMGMTDDFPVAIEEGATLIRVGRAIFGARG
jgi:pyridoxal phosphate enzyme (YggS family)